MVIKPSDALELFSFKIKSSSGVLCLKGYLDLLHAKSGTEKTLVDSFVQQHFGCGGCAFDYVDTPFIFFLGPVPT